MKRGQPYLRERDGEWQVVTGQLVVSRDANEAAAQASLIDLIQRRTRAALAVARARRRGEPTPPAPRPVMWPRKV